MIDFAFMLAGKSIVWTEPTGISAKFSDSAKRVSTPFASLLTRLDSLLRDPSCVIKQTILPSNVSIKSRLVSTKLGLMGEVIGNPLSQPYFF